MKLLEFIEDYCKPMIGKDYDHIMVFGLRGETLDLSTYSDPKIVMALAFEIINLELTGLGIDSTELETVYLSLLKQITEAQKIKTEKE